MDLLVVSGNIGVLDAVAAAFADEGGRYLEVRTPLAALHALEHDGPWTFVVADADTTPMGGFALARDVKAREQLGSEMPPVALLIARAQDKWLAEWSGADLIALKPVDPFDLHDALVGFVEHDEVPALPDIVGGGGPMRAEARHVEEAGAEGGGGGLTGGGP